MDIRKLLKSIDLFSNLSDLEIDEVASSGKLKVFPKGSTIFNQGQKATGAYIIISGRVKIYKLGSDGRQYILHIFGPGELFAESAMFAGKTYPAYSETMQDSSLFYISKDRFLYVIEKKPSLAMKMLASQAVRLRKFAAKIEDLSLKEVSARLAGYLLEQAKISGKEIENGLAIKLSMNKTQLAAYLGTISETLSRTFTSFKDKGLIEEQDSTLIIKNSEKLRDIAM